MTANSREQIEWRAMAGRVTWAGPLIMLVARSVLAVICQALVAALFFRGSAEAWDRAGDWWRVYGTAIDLGSIALLAWLARREGIHLLDLGTYRRERWLRDVLIGLGLFVPTFILTMFLPGSIAGLALYGSTSPALASPLPTIGLLYTLVIWPIIWAFAEDNTYFGYSLPRLEALTGRPWLAVVLLSLFATLQHGFLPFVLDWRHFAYRLLGSLLVIVVLCLLYRRHRRLLPIHIIHWAGNVIGIVSIVFLSPAGGG